MYRQYQMPHRQGNPVVRSRVVLAVVVLWLALVDFASAQESVCAEVRIEIRQELTLERQGFDAQMRIINSIGLPLNEVKIDLEFFDENDQVVAASSDPNATGVAFFARQSSLSGVDSIGGEGTISPNTTAEIHWLIIPSATAGGELPSGKLYLVGAKVYYNLGGDDTCITISPDSILVKPLPELTLDYFLTEDVVADNGFTDIIEPPVPFFLGLRATNNGSGTFQELNLVTAQPEIVENDQGLAVEFKVTGAEVAGKPVDSGLKAPLGSLEPGGTKVVIWTMEATLNGKFTNFEAEFSHPDELGGQLTSLLQSVTSHNLVQPVRLDLPGRDDIRDFLAVNEEEFTLYESSGLDSPVTDQSSSASITLEASGSSASRYRLSAPETGGLIYFRLPDPHQGNRLLASVIRADGKEILIDNAWLSRPYRDGQNFDYFINVFDVNSSGQYTAVFEQQLLGPQRPRLQFIASRTVRPDTQVSFLLEASDADSPPPVILAEQLPPGANLLEQGDGTAVFDWTPTADQAGSYTITFTATDGSLVSEPRTSTITVLSPADSDGDGLDDEWEMQNFGTLDRDGRGDFDDDGLSDLAEFQQGADPKSARFQQIVLAEKSVTVDAGATLSVPLQYQTNDDNRALSGLAVRVHYDQSKLSFVDATELFARDLIQPQPAVEPPVLLEPQEDSDDLDRNPETTHFVTLVWESSESTWPLNDLPTDLATVNFAVSQDSSGASRSSVRFTPEKTATGYGFRADRLEISFASSGQTLDVDRDGEARALSDGLMIMRYLFGFRGDELTRGAVASGTSAENLAIISVRLSSMLDAGTLDVDGDGESRALSDGILIVRYLFGFRGIVLTAGVLPASATRNSAAIEAYLNAHLPR